MYRVHGDKVIRRRTNYRKENDIQKYTKILKHRCTRGTNKIK